MRGLFTIFSILIAGPALAGLTVCNEPGPSASGILAHKAERGVRTDGWRTVVPEQCKEVLGGDPARRPSALHANFGDGGLAAVGIVFCTESGLFAITGGQKCEARGHDAAPVFLAESGDGTASTLPRSAGAAADPSAASHERRISGMLGDCGIDPERQIVACEVLAGGVRYIVPDDGTTDVDLLMELAMLPSWTSVSATVDVREEQGDVARVVLLDLEVRADDEYQRLLDVLQGTWTEVGETGEGFLLDGTRYAETLMGSPLKQGNFDISSECLDRPGPHFTVTYDGGGQVCWVILDQTAERLHLRQAQDGTEIIYERRR